jgi:site-specific DNA-methyltransferase (adenine-specific)
MESETKYYFQNKECSLIDDDTFHALTLIKPRSIDLIFADPPYLLSGGGISCKSGKQVICDKGSWDKPLNIKEKIAFHRRWIHLCKRVLKDDGSIMISSTLHSVYAIGVALEMEGFSIINNIIWEKTNPAPNLACRCLTHSTETVIWARKIFANGKKGKHTFNYQKMKQINNGKQMKDFWSFEYEDEVFVSSTTPKREKQFGYHPTQKPLALLDRIIKCATNENDLVLDPFCGSGTTGVACLNNKRRFIGIDNDISYLAISEKRLIEAGGK